MRVTLPINEPRCKPESKPCDKKERCARFLVAADPGRPMADFLTTTAGTYWPGCTMFFDIARLRNQQQQAPKVHDAPKGLYLKLSGKR